MEKHDRQSFQAGHGMMMKVNVPKTTDLGKYCFFLYLCTGELLQVTVKKMTFSYHYAFEIYE
jgi:hypothetical protein